MASTARLKPPAPRKKPPRPPAIAHYVAPGYVTAGYVT